MNKRTKSLIEKYEADILLTADGATGEEWVARLKNKCIWCNGISTYSKRIFFAKRFKPTLKTYKIKIIKGGFFKKSKNLTIEKIREEAKKINLISPNAEATGLIAQLSSKEIKDMGLRCVVIMHDPFMYNKTAKLLTVGACALGSLISFCSIPPNVSRKSDVGFAFVVPE